MNIDIPHHFFIVSEGFRFHVRSIKPSDKDLLQKGFSKLSERSKYLRFFYPYTTLSDTQLNYFTEVDGIQHVAWGILDESKAEAIPVAVGRFVKFKDEKDVAEVAITVVDSYQRKGLGRILLATLNIIAGQIGLKKLRYHVLSENRFVLKTLKQFGILNKKNEGAVTIVDIKVIPNHKVISDNPEMQSFMAVMKKIEKEMGVDTNTSLSES